MSKKITPEVLNTIANLSRCGFTQYYIANVLGVSDTTVSRWKQENPEVRDALSISTDGLLSDVKSKLTETALSGSTASAVSAGQFLLNKYDTVAVVDDVIESNTDVRQSILADLQVVGNIDD